MYGQCLITIILTVALGASSQLAAASEPGTQASAPQSPLIACAHTAGGIQTALTAAANNGMDDDIRINAGSYPLTAPLAGYPQDLHSLTISGGWDSTCTQQNGGQTVLDGQGQTSLMYFYTTAANDIAVSDISFVSGASAQLGIATALHIATDGQALAERNIFLANQSDASQGVLLSGQTVIARNNLVVANQTYGAAMDLDCGGNPESLLIAVGNTILNNTAEFGGGMTMYCAGSNNDVTDYVANNLLWGNGDYDLEIYFPDGGFVTLYNNDIGEMTGSPGPDSSGNFSAAPVFAGLLNFHPASKSPTINRGRNCLIDGVGCESALGDTDLGGAPRIQGPSVDVGAYESDVLLYSGFEVVP